MEIRDYHTGDEKAILHLFELTFGKPMREQYWRWRFERNPVGKYYIKLMWEKELLIGHYAVSPFQFVVDNEITQASLSMTTMTHPDYSGKGIFKTLAEELYSFIAQKYDTKCVMGFPNKNSHYGFIKNLSWRDLAVIHHLVLETSSIKPCLSPMITRMETFDQSHSDLLKQITSAFRVSLNQSVDYLNWRYKENPFNKYYIFEHRDSVLSGFLVVKLYPMADGSYGAFIVENGIAMENISLLPEFLSHIIASFDLKISSVHTWLSLFDRRHIYYEKNGFVLGGKQTFLGVRVFDESLSDVLTEFKNWYYSYGDSDIY